MKVFPEGLEEMRKTGEGEFAKKFPSFLLAKRHNPYATGPMIQKLLATSFDKQAEYKKLTVQTLSRGEVWYERQEKWSEERNQMKERKPGPKTKTKMKDKLEGNSTEEEVEMLPQA